MAVLEPKLAILDETDSGLDIDALKVVSPASTNCNARQRPACHHHYQRLLNFIIPGFVHVLVDGRIARSGGKELRLELEEKGLRLDHQE